ncbi:MAG: 1-acyl-sn-glycerol-3-phosphate acyltransferase [Saprospiraceae bacterium]|nr:1-acyl-sn-glycerol-3-phosphate acyltransferase [Saprospiraceae bacterium]MCB0624126.1 1-acyl-sn-glycerol-3-phosphate acyltransferase [Saprospiraceae bacterium]MCB0676344.1 1-acyl-sn-glycerol-3-phosphate acyltransferase [Saprospiraceae bacterium]MCB0680739.1 1-acyl-sn-glycerol-3-phosphate acyltransferase [Saprospiraceae bacterium]
MLYYLTRPLARLTLGTFFRKIYLSHRERIPRDQPVILAANHPTAFMEPCILACWLKDPLHFVVRGDIFAKPFYARILRSLHMIAFYRMKDGGFSKIKNNYESFSAAESVLRARQPILILAEGRTIHEKRLRPLRKGAARLALGTADQHADLDVVIVPVGVNYTYADRFRSEVMIEFGEPLRVRDYLDSFREQNNQGILQLTEALRAELEKRVVIIERAEDEALTERLFQLYRHDHPEKGWPVVEENDRRVQAERELASWVNALPEPEKDRLRRLVADYWTALHSARLSDLGLQQPERFNLLATFLLLAGFPLAILGYFLNLLPARLAKYIGDTRVRYLEFRASVVAAVGMLAYLLYYSLAMLVGGIIWGWIAVPLVLTWPPLGYLFLLWRERYVGWKEALKVRLADRQETGQLREMREAIAALVWPGRSADPQQR